MKRRNKLIVLSGIFVFSLALVLLAGKDLVAKIFNKTVATVNGEIILKSEFDNKLERLLKEIPIEKDDPRMEELKEQVLDEMINEKLILQEVENKKIHVTNKEIEGGMERLEAGFPSKKALEDELKIKGITLQELREDVRKQLVANKLYEQVVMKEIVQPTEKEIEKFYKENKEDVHKLLGEQIYRNKVEKHKEKCLQNLRDKASIIKNKIE